MTNENVSVFEYRGTAILIIAHILALFVGFTVLAIVFQFPDVLRLPAAERLALYRDGQSIIQPTYWVLAMTGLTQIGISVFLFQSFRNRMRTALVFSLVFGVLCGILQTAGFIRWAILIPYLAEQMQTADTSAAATIALIEGAFNRYAGMALGEHLGNIFLGLWTLCIGIAMRNDRLFDRKLSYWGIALGIVAMSLSLEQLGIAPTLLSFILDFGFPAWAVWLLVVAVSLLRTNPEKGEGPILGWKTAAWAFVLYVAMVSPSFM